MKNLGLGLLAVFAVGVVGCDDDDNDNYNLRLVKVTETDYQKDRSVREFDTTTFNYNELGLLTELTRESSNDREGEDNKHAINYDDEGNITGVEIKGESLEVVVDSDGYITSIGDNDSGFKFEYDDYRNLVTFSGEDIPETKFTWNNHNVEKVVSDSVETSYTYDNRYNYLSATKLPRAIILAFDINYGHALISSNNVVRYTDKKNEGVEFIREYVYNGGLVIGYYTYEVLEDENGDEDYEPFKTTVLEYEKY